MRAARAPKGFTLLEVMVALMIMAVLSILTAQTMKSALDNRTFVSREISRDSQLADTLRIMRADIGAAFHYQDVYCKMDNDLAPTPAPNALGQQPLQQAPLYQPPVNPNQPQTNPTPRACAPDVTGFIGTTDALYFTTLSNVRTLTDSQESDQAKVGYFLKSCRSHLTKAPGQCLYRAISPILDADVDKPGPETLLLENVTEFKLRYLGTQHEDFVSEWKTGKNGTDEASKINFPYAVEITLTIQDKSNRNDHPATQTVLAPIYFENNPPKPGSGTPSPNQTPTNNPATRTTPPPAQAAKPGI